MAIPGEKSEAWEPTLPMLWQLVQDYGDGVLAENAERRLVLVNETFCKLFAIPVPPVELRGMDCAQAAESSKLLFVNEEEFLSRIAEILESGARVYGELLPLKDGRVFERDYIPLVDRRGPAGNFWIYRDVTERVQREELMHEEHVLRGAVVDSALDAVVVIDEAGHIVEFNPAAERMFLFDKEAVVGKKMSSTIMPEKYREMHEAGMKRYIETGVGTVIGKRIEISAMKSNGMVFSIELAINPIRTAAGQKFTAYIRDITGLKQSQQQLKDQRASALAVSEASSWLMEPTVSMSTVTRVVEHVAKASRVDRAHVFHHQQTNDGSAGVFLDFLWTKEEGSKEIDATTIELQEWGPIYSRWRAEFEANRPIYGYTRDLPTVEAEPLFAQNILSMVVVPICVDGELWGTIGFDDTEEERLWSETEVSILLSLASNIGAAIKRERLTHALVLSEESLHLRLAELRRKSEELEQATAMLISQERMATLGMITSSVAHEINSPLGAILNSAERILEEGVANDRHKKNLELIVRASMRTKDVIDRLLASSREKVDDGSSCDVGTAVKDCCDLYGRQLELLGINVIRNERPLPLARCNHNDVVQIITNLLINARDALLATTGSQMPTIEITTEVRESTIEIHVDDNGPGVPSDALANVFEPFFTTKERGKGTGLGLWISRRIARDSNGDVLLENTGHGARATLIVPITDEGGADHA